MMLLPADLVSARVLVLMPSRKDAERTTLLLQEGGVPSWACDDLAEMCRELRHGAGALLLTEEAIVMDRSGQLAEALRTQPPWSAIPIVVVARGQAQGIESMTSSGITGLVVVERPVRTRTLLSVTLAALRARQNQYQIRDALLLLARQAEQLQDADRRKDEFLATLAHELRNPLAPIQSGLDLLVYSREGPAAERAVAVMQRQVRHMVRLIDDLLDVSRITQGKFELKRARVTVGDVLDAAIEASRPLIERGNHRLEVARDHASLVLDADVTRLAQVVSNLLNNASKYTPPGGSIWLSADQDGGEAVITVRDNGVGIPEEHLNRVFEMFSQVNPAEKRAQDGLGIGLALVRSLVRLHGGSVSAASAGPGQGSTFTVRIPLARAADARAPGP